MRWSDSFVRQKGWDNDGAAIPSPRDGEVGSGLVVLRRVVLRGALKRFVGRLDAP